MGGDKGRTRKGRKNEGTGGGDIGAGNSQAGTLGRDQLLVKEPKQLLVGGKVAKGTKAAQQAASKKRIAEYDKKLKWDAIRRNTGMWNNGVRSL